MAEAGVTRPTVNSAGAVVVRRRPSLLLMKVRASAAEPSLELGLARLKEQCESYSQWLKRLGAVQVDVGEPHFLDQADKDPMVKMREAATRGLRRRTPGGAEPGVPGRDVIAVLTALWEIGSQSAEEVLLLVDRLRFESAPEAAAAAPEAVEPTPWASPEEQLQNLLATMHEPPPDDSGAPKFLFISRLEGESFERASSEAFTRARANAELLAQAAGRRLGTLRSVHATPIGLGDSRHDRLMDRQRCLALLAGSSYLPGEYEIVSDDARAAEFSVGVNLTYELE